MPTKFGKLISSKIFSKIFVICYVISVVFIAVETNNALSLLCNSTVLAVVLYILTAVVGLLVIVKKEMKCRPIKKILNFVRCFTIYFYQLFVLWELGCLLFRVNASIKAIGIGAVYAVSVVIVLAGYLHTKVIKTKTYDIDLGKNGDKLKIALISDIHLGGFVSSKHIRKVVEKINVLSADIVLIAGDIFDGDNSLLDHKAELKRISKVFRKIKSNKGVYAVLGNHDPSLEDKRLKHFLHESKINVLNNAMVEFDRFVLAGQTDATNKERVSLEEILKPNKSDKPIILLDHKPEGIDNAVENHVSLALYGHTHRGQFFPVTIFTKWANGRTKHYGIAKKCDTFSVITSGVGFFSLPIRIGTSNEVVEINVNL